MSILIVDDSPDERELLQRILQNAGFPQILTADSAAAAFRCLGLDGSGEGTGGVDLILMDLVMPQMDGLEACRRIKAKERFQDIPIIVITVRTEAEDLRAALGAGALDYIKKPVNPVELMARVCSAWNLKEEMASRKLRERELAQALQEVKVLRGLVTMCSSCKRIRSSTGSWQHIEDYLREHSELIIHDTLCVHCRTQRQPDRGRA